MIGDSEVLRASLERLGALAPDEVDIEGLLHEVMAAVELLFRLDGAGVMLVDDQQILRSVATTDERGAALDRAQQQAGTGPCIQGFIYNQPVASADIRADDRFQAVAELLPADGVRAVLGVPIRLGGGPVGVLNLYVDQPHDWADPEIDALGAYGDLLGTLLGTGLVAHRNDTLARQLQYALDHRVVIERAVGYLMGTGGIDATAAFDRLRRAARARRCQVGEVASRLLDGGGLD